MSTRLLPSPLLALGLATALLACEAPHTAPGKTANTTLSSAPAATGSAPSGNSSSEVVQAPNFPPQPRKLLVHLVPLGAVPDDTLRSAASGLESHAQVQAIVEPPHPLPASCRSTQQGRYRAEKILEFLDSLTGSEGKVIGITEVDIVAQKGNNPNWGVLGLGALDGRTSVLSTHRMQRKWEGGGVSRELVQERLWKVALHELGHTLGLEHCPTVGCIMEDGHGTVKTTDRDNALCERCLGLFNVAAERNIDAMQHK